MILGVTSGHTVAWTTATKLAIVIIDNYDVILVFQCLWLQRQQPAICLLQVSAVSHINSHV